MAYLIQMRSFAGACEVKRLRVQNRGGIDVIPGRDTVAIQLTELLEQQVPGNLM